MIMAILTNVGFDVTHFTPVTRPARRATTTRYIALLYSQLYIMFVNWPVGVVTNYSNDTCCLSVSAECEQMSSVM